MSPALTDGVFTNSATWEEEICSTKPSLVAQVVKNLPAVQETQIRSLDQEDLWEKGMATIPVFLPGKAHGQTTWQATVHGVAKSQT